MARSTRGLFLPHCMPCCSLRRQKVTLGHVIDDDAEAGRKMIYVESCTAFLSANTRIRLGPSCLAIEGQNHLLHVLRAGVRAKFADNTSSVILCPLRIVFWSSSRLYLANYGWYWPPWKRSFAGAVARPRCKEAQILVATLIPLWQVCSCPPGSVMVPDIHLFFSCTACYDLSCFVWTVIGRPSGQSQEDEKVRCSEANAEPE